MKKFDDEEVPEAMRCHEDHSREIHDVYDHACDTTNVDDPNLFADGYVIDHVDELVEDVDGECAFTDGDAHPFF